MNSKRKLRSLEVPGVTHGAAPIPMGSRVGNTIYSSGILGKDPATDQLPEDAESQALFAFKNMGTLLEVGGATLNDVVRMTVYLKDDSLRDVLNKECLAAFPDPHDRPARHVHIHPLRGAMLIQIEIVAVVEA
jgi:2-iminobutanoate/2-iminopropanoate deaminase